MSDKPYPVSPILPTESAVESGHVAPGYAGGEVGLEEEAAASSGGTEDRQESEEILPQKPQASPDHPTASQVADHELTHLHYRAWCPDCVEVFGRERAHLAQDPAGRVVPLVAIDYCFISEKGVHLKNEVDYDWNSAPDTVLDSWPAVAARAETTSCTRYPRKVSTRMGMRRSVSPKAYCP